MNERSSTLPRRENRVAAPRMLDPLSLALSPLWGARGRIVPPAWPWWMPLSPAGGEGNPSGELVIAGPCAVAIRFALPGAKRR
ncbi:MAG: hypothetical protein LBE85_05470, partial [Candidatus Accumulibacter sp.]|nr:hypothetical protein [Accumulibacter sp.]